MWRSVDTNIWRGRIDGADGERALRWHQRVLVLDDPAENLQPSLPGSALLGFACDAGVARNHGRSGAIEGPAALRTALADTAWHQTTPVYDAGDVLCRGEALEASQAALGERVAALLVAGHRPLLLGGGHEIAWGSWQGIARHFADRRKPIIGILCFDAHFDLHAGAISHSGTPFRQIAEDCAARNWPFRHVCLGIARQANSSALFERAQSLGVRWITDEQLSPWQLETTRSVLNHFLRQIDALYLSIDLGVLPASAAPGVSTPGTRGTELAVLESLLDDVLASGKLLLAEVAELNPLFDIDNHTARLAARLVARLAP